MSAPKTRNAWGFMAKVESSYGTPATLVGSNDGVLLSQRPEPDFSQYLDEGDRGRAPGGAPRPRAAMSGRFGSLRLMSEMIGGGAAYSASVFGSIHTLLRGCGLEATGSFTGGSEKWTFAPEIGPSGLDSLTMEAYLDGQLYKLSGAYGSFEVGAEGPAVPEWDFNFMGLADKPTDVAIPAISSYPPATRLPAKSLGIGFTLGTFTAAVMRRWRFIQNREHDAARANQNTSAGHQGFTPGGYNPILEVTIEKVTLATSGPYHTSSTLNPYELKELGTQLICKLDVGSTQYNRWKLGAGLTGGEAQAQIVGVEDGEEGPTSTWDLTIEFKSSSYTANDAFAITVD